MKKSDKISQAEKEFHDFLEVHAPALEGRLREALFDYFNENPTDSIDLELYLMQCVASFLNSYTECLLKYEDMPPDIVEQAQKYGRGVAMKTFEQERIEEQSVEYLVTMPAGEA